MAIDRSQIRRVDLPTEEINVPEIGGEVTVRGMDLPTHMAFQAERRRLTRPRDGETEDDAKTRAGAPLAALVLEACVLAGDGLPVYTRAEWGAFGVRHPEVMTRLWEAAIRLSGHDAAAEKKA